MPVHPRQGVKKIITIKTNNTSTPSKIKVEGIQLEDSKQIANAFNDYFANIGSKLENLIPKGNISAIDYLSHRHLESFFLFPTSPAEVKNEILNLNSI